MRRHVDQVTGVGCERLRQAVGCRFREARVRAVFHEVNIEVRTLRMIGIARHHGFDKSDGFGNPWLGGLSVCHPVIPRQRVHRRFGRKQRDIVVRGIVACNRQHCVGIGAIERSPVCVGSLGIAFGERHDQRPLGRGDGAGQHLGLPDRPDGLCIGFGREWGIDVGPMRQRLTPPAHGARRIEPLRFTERRDRGGVVEAVGEPYSLVEIALRQGRVGRDPEIDPAEPIMERYRRRRIGPHDGS